MNRGIMNRSIKYFFYLLCLLINSTLFSQIVVTHNDMPNVNTNYLINLKNNFGASFAFAPSDSNYIWDIRNVSLNNWRTDSFLEISASPLAYYMYFNNYLDPERRATITKATGEGMNIPGITIEDIFVFYKESTDKFSEVGFGAKVNDVPTPVKYDNPDVHYHFPISFGNVDSSASNFAINIPSYGYLGRKLKRINTVDGWGTLVTENGQFPVMRVYSIVQTEDTVYYSQYQQGFKFNSTLKEYKWLGLGIGVPLLYVADRMGSVTIEVYDSINYVPASIAQINKDASFVLYPNPTKEDIFIQYKLEKSSQVNYHIKDLQGRTLFTVEKGFINSGLVLDKINLRSLRLPKGIYMLIIENSSTHLSQKFVIV